MILDYEITWSSNSNILEPARIGSLKENDLRYYHFTGDVIFKDRDMDFSAHWDWVPILDFALSMKAIGSQILETRSEEFVYTESDATIRFVAKDDELVITTNYADGQINVSYDVFMKHVDNFYLKIRKDINERYPALILDEVLRTYR